MVPPTAQLPREMVAKAIREADRLGSGIVEDDFQEMIVKWAVPHPDDRAAPSLHSPPASIPAKSTTPNATVIVQSAENGRMTTVSADLGA